MDKNILIPLETNPFPDIVFIDCEATSLEIPSHPIEIGLGWCDNTSQSYLVKAPDIWKKYNWHPKSSAVHKIKPEQTQQFGQTVEWLADWMNTTLKDKMVFSDNPTYESYWLGELFKAANIQPLFDIKNSYQLISSALINFKKPDAKFNQLKEDVSKICPITHRAGDDALFWAILFRQATQAVV